MDNRKMIEEIEKERRERKIRERELENKKKQDERERKRDPRSKFQNEDDFRYAIWYYHKRLKLMKISLFPFALSIICLIDFLRNPSFGSYLEFGIFMGITRAISTNRGDKSEDFRLLYDFFEQDSVLRFSERMKSFFISLFFGPITFLYHIYDFLEVIRHKNRPKPKYYIELSSDEKKIGRIDESGNIYLDK